MAQKAQLPDALVLGGGGVIGEAWMTGILAGVESATGLDFRRCGLFIGTSAGSMVAAYLAAGDTPRRPGDVGAEAAEEEAIAAGPAALLRRAGRLGRSLTDPFAPLALGIGERLGARPRASVLARLPQAKMELDDLGARIERLGARFDGRLRIVAVDSASGRRVVFGAPGAPKASVSQAVRASCSIPGYSGRSRSAAAPIRTGGSGVPRT